MFNIRVTRSGRGASIVAGIAFGLLSLVAREALADCPTGYVPCGVSHCSLEGATCCASAGDEAVSCPAGDTCLQTGSGVTCVSPGPAPGTPCNGYATCGNACTNSLNPVCCPDGLIAPTEADCDTSSSSNQSCAVARELAGERRRERAGARRGRDRAHVEGAPPGLAFDGPRRASRAPRPIWRGAICYTFAARGRDGSNAERERRG